MMAYSNILGSFGVLACSLNIIVRVKICVRYVATSKDSSKLMMLRENALFGKGCSPNMPLHNILVLYTTFSFICLIYLKDN